MQLRQVSNVPGTAGFEVDGSLHCPCSLGSGINVWILGMIVAYYEDVYEDVAVTVFQDTQPTLSLTFL